MTTTNKLRKVSIQDADGIPTTANLWNSTSGTKLEAGDKILLKDVTVVYDKFMNTNVLSVNREDQIYVST